MKTYTIEISEDVNRALINRQDYVGESADSVLRREFELPEAGGANLQGNPPGPAGPRHTELETFLRSPNFVRHRNVTDRYLELLAWLGHEHVQNGFVEKLLSIQGRTRLYFARTEDEIRQAGKSTHPKPIPGLDLWAMTNSETDKKCEVVRQVMDVLNYAPSAIAVAIEALRR